MQVLEQDFFFDHPKPTVEIWNTFTGQKIPATYRYIRYQEAGVPTVPAGVPVFDI